MDLQRSYSELRLRLPFALRLHDVENRVDRTDDPFRALVASEPVVFFAQAFDISSFEKTKDVADELRSDVFFRAEARGAHNGTQGSAQVALLALTAGERRENCAVCLNYELWVGRYQH